METTPLMNYILRLASFGGEPLYILASDPVDYRVANSFRVVIECIYQLYIDGYLKCGWHSLNDDNFVIIDNLSWEQLEEYLRRNEKDGFETYPKEGGEYFFETTESGEMIISEDYCLPGLEC